MPVFDAHAEGYDRPPIRGRGTVLVVDDQEFMRRVLGDTLVRAGHRTLLAGGVDEAVDLAAREAPQVVIVDLVMPDGGGVELCRRLDARDGRRPHIIVVSALGDRGAMLDAFAAGADDFLRKPIEPTEMLARVGAALRGWRYRRLADRLTERARRDARRSREILDAISEGLLVVAADGRIDEANPAAGRLLGLSAADIVGMRPPYPWWPEHAREAAGLTAPDTDAAGREREVVLQRSDGRPFPALMCVSPLDGNVGVSGGHILTIRDLTDQTRARRALESSHQEQRALRTIAEAIARDAPIIEIFTTISRELSQVFAVEHGFVVDFTAAGALIVAAADLRCVGTVLPTGDGGLLAQMRVTGAPTHLDHHGLPWAHPARILADRCGITLAAAAPVAPPTGLWGAVMIATGASDAPGRDLGDQRARLAGFAEMAALAVAREHNRERLVRQAATDPLTGIANRRTFTHTLARQRVRLMRENRSLTLLVADLDNFKRVNDTYGHAVGDEVLARFARLLTDAARADDLVARIGGEEFAWLMPDTDLAAGLAAGERLRARCEETTFGRAGRITCSAGVGRLQPGESDTRLIVRCDEALYRAKNGGRNRVEAAGHDAPAAGSPSGSSGRSATAV